MSRIMDHGPSYGVHGLLDGDVICVILFCAQTLSTLKNDYLVYANLTHRLIVVVFPYIKACQFPRRHLCTGCHRRCRQPSPHRLLGDRDLDGRLTCCSRESDMFLKAPAMFKIICSISVTRCSRLFGNVVKAIVGAASMSSTGNASTS